METTIPRKQTSFRLREDLLERLKVAARMANSSLNSYVETVLMDEVYRIPNEETRMAFEEAKSGDYKKNAPIDTTSVDSMINSILNEESNPFQSV